MLYPEYYLVHYLCAYHHLRDCFPGNISYDNWFQECSEKEDAKKRFGIQIPHHLVGKENLSRP